MTKQEATVTLELPDGWELTGEYRQPRAGENYLLNKAVNKAPFNYDSPFFIVRRIPMPKVPKWLGCVKSYKTGEIIFVAKIKNGYVYGIDSEGNTIKSWNENLIPYNHPEVPNSWELMKYFLAEE